MALINTLQKETSFMMMTGFLSTYQSKESSGSVTNSE